MQCRTLGRAGVQISELCLDPRTPRTMEHLKSQLPAADVELSTELLDRIDEIVPSDVTINPDDNMSFGSTLDAAARRR